MSSAAMDRPGAEPFLACAPRPNKVTLYGVSSGKTNPTALALVPMSRRLPWLNAKIENGVGATSRKRGEG